MAFRNAHNFTIQQANMTDITAQFAQVNITHVQERAKSLSPIGIVPPSTSQNFTGQEEYLEKLHQHFDVNNYTVRKMFLLYGMGGIGKTQICLKFKDNVTDNYLYIFWIDATSSDTVEQSLKDIYKIYSMNMSQGMSYSAAMVLQWISALKEKWLMIYDNADGSPDIVEEFLPPGNKGHILISSRNPEHKRIVSPSNSMEVDVMHESTAILLLLKAAGLTDQSEKHHILASEICSKLHYLPLAIDQAGAYINAGRCSIEKYLSIYDKYSSRLMDNKSFRGASKYDKTVYGTWEISYKKIQEMASDKDNEEIAMAAQYAITLINMCAFMHHEHISDEIFERAAKNYHEQVDYWKDDTLPTVIQTIDTHILNFDQSNEWDEWKYQDSIGILISFSLIKRTVNGSKFGLHPLVQKWCQDRLKMKEKNLWEVNARCVLLISITMEESTAEHMYLSALLLHITQNLSCEDLQTMKYYDDLFWLLRYVASKNEKYDILCIIDQRIFEMVRGEYSDLNPEILVCMGNLASTYRKLGKLAEAEKLEVQVLEMSDKILGPEHPETLISMANLAVTYGKLGKYAEAETLEEQAVDIKCRTLGPEHPDTLQSMANLAVTYGNLGKYAKAEKVEVQVLEMKGKILGPEHLDTLTSMANLASTYGYLGKYAEAERLEVQVLEMRNRILGPEHPDTLKSTANLAVTYYKIGKYAETERLEQQVLDMRSRILGPKHPDTLESMSNLAVTYHNFGEYPQAESLHMKVLEMRGRIQGPRHPYTIASMENLTFTYRALGKFSEAEELERQLPNLYN